MKVTLIGIDLAKSIFQICGVNQVGKRVFNRQVRRARLMELLMQHPDATIAMEACSGSNYWGRTLEQHGYKSGRHFSANLGLVPKEHSSGGQQKLAGITKRGNQYLRRLLIQGAWSVVRNVDKNDDRLSRWARQLVERRGKHKAVVAVANKMARIMWSMLYHQTEYRAN